MHALRRISALWGYGWRHAPQQGNGLAALLAVQTLGANEVLCMWHPVWTLRRLRRAAVLTDNVKVTGSPVLSASPRGLPGLEVDLQQAMIGKIFSTWLFDKPDINLIRVIVKAETGTHKFYFPEFMEVKRG